MKSILVNLLTSLLENPEDSSIIPIIADCLREFHRNHKEVETYARLIQKDLSVKIVIDILMKFESRKIRKEVSKCLRELSSKFLRGSSWDNRRKKYQKKLFAKSLIDSDTKFFDWFHKNERNSLLNCLKN